MTTLMFQPRFVEPIRSGQKYQTIRPPRKRPINVGERLSLRMWEGAAYRSPQIPIGEATCSAVFDIDVAEWGVMIGIGPQLAGDVLEHFARADGFSSWKEMRSFFAYFYGLPRKSMKLIQWVGLQ